MKLFYRTLGGGEPLFILHGLFGSSENWMTHARHWAKQYKVILPDMRNHGQSPHSDVMDYPSMASDICELADDLGLHTFFLLGHSMGGKVGMTIADTCRGLVRKLVVADIAPKQYPVHHKWILDGLMSIDPATLKSRKEADEILEKYVSQPAIRQFLLKNLRRDHDGRFSWKLNLKVIFKSIEKVGAATLPSEKITIPALFIRGINSDYITDEDILMIRKYFSDSRVESIGNAGHWLHAEQPVIFMKLVEDFLAEGASQLKAQQ